MKKLLFLAAASLTLFACDSKDESKNIQEYIEVEFMAEAPAIDMEVSVGTKAEARMIACDFPEAKGIQRLYVAENTPFKVLLPANKQVKGTFAYVKGYDEAKYWEPWAGFNAKLLYLNSSTDADAYTAVWYGYPEEYINKTIKLERKASKFTLSEGTIPEGYHLEHKTWNKAVYDWDYPGINGVLNYIDFMGYYPVKVKENPTFPSFEYAEVLIKVISDNTTNIAAAGESVFEKKFVITALPNEYKTVIFNTSLSFDPGLTAIICDIDMFETTETIEVDNLVP